MSTNRKVQEQLNGALGSFGQNLGNWWYGDVMRNIGRKSTSKPTDMAKGLNRNPTREPRDMGKGLHMNPTKDWRKGGKYNPIVSPAPSPAPSPSPSPSPSTPSAATARNSPSPSGGPAKGTNTGFKPMSLDTAAGLAGRPIADINSFQSTALPTTAQGDMQFAKGVSDVDMFSRELTAGKASKYMKGYTGDNRDPEAMQAWAINQGYMPNSTRELPTNTQKGSSETPDRADQSRQIEFEGENGTLFGGDYGDTTAMELASAPSARQMQARAAFLDAPDGESVRGARAANAIYGIVRDSGNFYANDGGKLQQITGEGASKLRSEQIDAQGLKDYYVKEIIDRADPSNSDNPQVEGNPGGPLDGFENLGQASAKNVDMKADNLQPKEGAALSLGYSAGDFNNDLANQEIDGHAAGRAATFGENTVNKASELIRNQMNNSFQLGM